MGKTTSIDLDEHLAAYVETQVSQGRYASASDVVSEGLRRLEEDEAQIEALRAALIEGEESGEPEEFDVEQFLAEVFPERVPAA